MHYKKLNIDNFQSIQKRIISYIVDFASLDINTSEEKVFFKFVSDENLEKFKRDIPELFQCIRNHLGSEITLMSYVYVDGLIEIPIHTDSADDKLKRRIRLNWPIINSESAETIFYEKNNENVVSEIHSYKSGVSGRVYNPSDCYEIDRYILNVPTLMNVRQLHAVELIDYKLPRILLTMRLSNEEEVYQKYFN
jgi:hypothetical protein